MKVQYTNAARRGLKKLEPEIRARVSVKIHALETDAMPMGVESVKGVTGGFRIRVGDWRIVYTIGETSVWVVKIAHRREVYDRLGKRYRKR